MEADANAPHSNVFVPLVERGLTFRIRAHALKSLTRRSKELGPQFYSADAVVVAPHPDDETLGCGGTIALKLKAGARVTVIFMTDGGNSHAHLMPRIELVDLRRAEAKAACRRLGIPDDHVCFLDFRDGELMSSIEEAAAALAVPLALRRPAQLFLPHRDDVLADHVATYRAAIHACVLAGLSPIRFEYPVWLWDQWPWTNPLSAPRGRRRRTKMFSTAMISRFGLRLSRLLNVCVEIDAALRTKEAALAEHKTQVARHEDRPEWLTLGDIDEGVWLSHFGRSREFFRMSQDN